MKSLAFRIRKRYFDAIVSGQKMVEFRPDTPFWRSRIGGKEVEGEALWIAIFICGRRIHRRFITLIQKIDTPTWFSEQGKKDICTPKCYVIHLGTEVSGGSATVLEEMRGAPAEARQLYKYCASRQP